MPHKNLVLVRSFRQHEHEWSTGLCDVCCKEPCYCLSGFFCFPCTNYSIRKDALGGDLRNYRCFQMYYCDCLGYCCPCQESCGSCCLWTPWAPWRYSWTQCYMANGPRAALYDSMTA